MGHTNVASTRNAFTRYKKRWAFGNISTKTTATVTDEAGDGGMYPSPPFLIFLYSLYSESSNTCLIYTTVTLKPNNDANKVAKKRGRRSAKASPTKKSASTAESSDDGQGAADLKAEASDTD